MVFPLPSHAIEMYLYGYFTDSAEIVYHITGETIIRYIMLMAIRMRGGQFTQITPPGKCLC